MIQRQDIVGARITDIHYIDRVTDIHYPEYPDGVIEGYNCRTTYFTVDSGLTFTIPWPGNEWRMSELPADAKEAPDTYLVESNRLKFGWFGGLRFFKFKSWTNDVVKSIKERTIKGVFCQKGYYMTDSVSIVFDDGSRVHCTLVAPEGIPAGSFYQTKDDIQDTSELEDIFDVPILM